MTMNTDQASIRTAQLSRALASTRRVLERVRPAQLDAPTPCASWNAGALIQHFIGTARWAATTISTGDQVIDENYLADDALDRYDEASRAALAAFEAPGALEKTVTLEFGEYSGHALMNLVTTDQFTHGWDLARALRHPTNLDPELADELLARARTEIPDAYRGPDGTAPFGPAVAPRTDAGPADRLAAFLGRAT
jgi:uncharacterized protein (TIGR03086 family)